MTTGASSSAGGGVASSSPAPSKGPAPQGGGGGGVSGPAPPSRLFQSSLLEPKDDLDEKHDRCYNLVMSLIGGHAHSGAGVGGANNSGGGGNAPSEMKSEKEAHDVINQAVSKDQKTHEEVCLGFLVAILSPQTSTDPELAARYHRDLTMVARDGLQVNIV